MSFSGDVHHSSSTFNYWPINMGVFKSVIYSLISKRQPNLVLLYLRIYYTNLPHVDEPTMSVRD